MIPQKPPVFERILTAIRQFVLTLPMYLEGWRFIQVHKPYRGLSKYGLFFWFLISLGLMMGWHFFSETFQFFKKATEAPEQLGLTMSSMFSNLTLEKVQNSLTGGRKYLIMIALEVVVYHFIQRTLEIRIGRKPDFTLRAFIDAQVRIIKVSLAAWVLELIFTVIMKVALGIIGLSFLEKGGGFAIQCYFLGWSMVDNYNECFGLKVTESEKRTRLHAVGIALATGLVTYLLMYVPLIGVVVATMLGAVTATLAMERFAPITESEKAYYETLRLAEKQKRAKSKRGAGIA